MNMDHLLKEPLWKLTGEEFLKLLTNIDKDTPETPIEPETTGFPKYVYGIRGIANLLDCSISTANRIKKKGILDDAIIQQGRTIMVDVNRALQLLRENPDS